jgi:hypothetical protein
MALIVHVEPTDLNDRYTRDYLRVMVEHTLDRGHEVHVIDETCVLTRESFTNKEIGADPGVFILHSCWHQVARDEMIERMRNAVDLIIVVRKHPVPTFRALEALFTAAQRMMNRLDDVKSYHTSLKHRIDETSKDSTAVLELGRKLINPRAT